jgi:hypothetical protein
MKLSAPGMLMPLFNREREMQPNKFQTLLQRADFWPSFHAYRRGEAPALVQVLAVPKVVRHSNENMSARLA